MSVNKYLPHLLVLPEDDANRQLANGFLLCPSLVTRSVQVLPEVGGWRLVLKRFRSDHVYEMDLYPNRFMALLIDFDGSGDRLNAVKSEIPADLLDRVFILGVLTEPEKLKRDRRDSFENIGKALAEDCGENTFKSWRHPLLRHNAGELERLNGRVRPWLFPKAGLIPRV